MKTITAIILAILLSAFVAAPIASACPMCADAIANANSSASEDEIDHFPAAMNQSIYLMLSVAYTTFGVVGFMIYRGANRNAEFLVANSQAS
ncbi:MAG: hypothetical protein EXS16_06975 [Gemmataceae bacterium]|nr:hypothetical protein [Gemmataceae bacterium]